MESGVYSPDIRCIDGDGQYYECTKVRVILWNLPGDESMLYTGQLLLMSDNSDSASKPSKSQKLLQVRTIIKPRKSKPEQNAAASSKIFSALKNADIQFNSSTSPTFTPTLTTSASTANGTVTNTTGISVTTATCLTTASKTKSTTALPISNSTTKVSTSNASSSFSIFGTGVSGSSSNGLDSKYAFPVLTTKPSTSPKDSVTAPSSTEISSAMTTSSAACSPFSFAPVVNSPTASDSKPQTFNFSAAKPATLNSCIKFEFNNNLPSNASLQHGSSVLKAPHKAVAATGGSNDRVAREGFVGASKYPFPSSPESHLDPRNKMEKEDKEIYANMKKERSKEKHVRGTDSGRGRTESRKSREEDNSLQNELLKAQLQCFQIQHSLYKTLIAKLRNMESKSELQVSEMSAESDDVQSLLLPLEALLRCSDIQLGLHHGISVALDSNTGAGPQDDGHGGFKNEENIGHMIYDKDELLVESRSLMNHTKFAQSLVCLHLSNPYSSDLRYASGEDRVIVQTFIPSIRWYVPHGEGKLVSRDGNLIYEGQWKKGKRWGRGKGFIFSGTELSASKNQYGIYEGQWWSNMRHGHGRLVFASCAVYEGEWQYDLMSGVGSMHSPDGSVLEGLWDENEPSGCGMFTWPNGTVEYREYQNGQVLRALQSPEETKRISPLNEVMREYSVLRLKYQMLEEDKSRLEKSESRLEKEKAELEHYREKLNENNQERVKQLRAKFAEQLRKKEKSIVKKHEMDLKEATERHGKKIEELEDKIHQVEVELESKKSDLMCQICFERDRNCILMPCSHLLYCQLCITKLHADAAEKHARCPACRGPINSQINCNINQ